MKMGPALLLRRCRCCCCCCGARSLGQAGLIGVHQIMQIMGVPRLRGGAGPTISSDTGGVAASGAGYVGRVSRRK